MLSQSQSTLGMDWHCPPSQLSDHARFIRNVDWAATSLGAPGSWPSQLHQTIDLILADPTPAAVMWGDRLTMIYNEAFCEFAGTKHPTLMGASPIDAYAEVWEPMFAPIVERGRRLGQATRHKDVCLFLHRHGYLEECYVTYTFTPMLGKSKKVVGFHHTAVETTAEVLAERRTGTMLALSDSAAVSRSLGDYWNAVLKAFEPNVQDVPYVLAYSFQDPHDRQSISTGSDTDSRASSGEHVPKSCTLAGAVGKSVVQIPLSFDVTDVFDPFIQVVRQSVKSGELIHVHQHDGSMPDWLHGPVPGRSFDDAVPSAVIMPIKPTTQDFAEGKSSVGFLILGLNPRRQFDKDHEKFLRLWATTLRTSAASIVLLEREIQRQKQLKQQLTVSARHIQESETKFSRFAEMSNVAMWITDAVGNLLYANKAWHKQMPGIKGDEGPFCWRSCVPEDSQKSVADNWRRLLDDKVSVSFECRLSFPWSPPGASSAEVTTGSSWVLTSAAPVVDEDGNVVTVWGCNTDISHQKWAEGLKDQRLSDVLESKRQSENFIDMISHELRNPLGAILQSAELISSTLEDTGSKESNSFVLVEKTSFETIGESTQTIALCAQHQKRIVDDILTLSKLDARLLVVSPAEVDPISTVRHALKLHQQELQNAQIESLLRVKRHYRDLNVDRVLLDPSRLLQVLINLITNAIKFTQFQEHRQIIIELDASTENPGDDQATADCFAPISSKSKPPCGPEWGKGEELYIKVEVHDTGCGLTPQEIKKLFMRFSQASPKTHVQYGGSGLGLFICKELTELQGGRIGVKSTQGKGSVFMFYVRAKRATTYQEPTAEDTAAKLRRMGISEDKAEESGKRNLLRPNAVNPLNRNHSASQNPVVGSATDSDTLHVLVVEDNLINQQVMAKQLKQKGCIVHLANHGADALIHLQKSTFAKGCGPSATPLSIVLLDLEMPVMDGLTCIKKIREMQKSGELTRPVPVIAVTANARFEQVENAKACGMDDVITKPFRIAELMPQMYNLIAKTSAA